MCSSCSTYVFVAWPHQTQRFSIKLLAKDKVKWGVKRETEEIPIRECLYKHTGCYRDTVATEPIRRLIDYD